MYKINFSNGTNLFSGLGKDPIESIYPIKVNSGDVMICIRQGGKLLGYAYVASKEHWLNLWQTTMFSNQENYPLLQYPWLVADNLLNDSQKDVIILQHPDGVRFYQPDTTKLGLNLLKEDGHFHEVYGNSLLWGHFYPDVDEIGVMARNSTGVSFYVIGRDSLWANTTYPLFPLGSNWSVTSTWSASDTKLFITKLRHNDPSIIGLRTPKGLEFYQFNASYLLEKVIGTSCVTKPSSSISAQDHLFFGDITHQRYQDILHLNDSGLFMYQYDEHQKDYRFLRCDISFTPSSGWLPEYSDSIRLTDLTGDGRDDLIFTGLQGLTVLTFDGTPATWKILLAPEQLSGSQRYASVVGTLPAIPPKLLERSIFTQDAEGKVQWAKVMSAPAPIPPSTAPKTIATSTHPSTGPPSYRDDLFPEQIKRTNLPEKPTLRWSEQWDDSFLKGAVDPASGHALLNIPLVDTFASTGWRLQVYLSYNDQATTSNLLGIGWSLPLAQDYIFVDHQSSIYPEDARYYLMAQGRLHRLKFKANDRGVQRFKVAEEVEGFQITIDYQQSEQRWITESRAEQATYGKANHSAAQDALQWSLGWPNWRGIGRDKSTQQPLITAWYLNMRLDKDNRRTLYYHYEKDSATIVGGKTYDAALRLKTISDGQYMKLSLDYSLKDDGEYTPPNPIDKDGNIIFPTPLDQSHYLQGYSITTVTYSQTLKFAFQVNDSKRFLTSVQQQFLSHTEPVLQFSYQTVLEKPLLQSCSLLPRGSTVHFNYQSLAPTEPAIEYRYPIRERSKIGYGSDYAVMAYRDLNPTAGKVTLRITNRSMTQTIIDCSVNKELSCPSAESEIKDYAIQAYQNSFIVFTESTQKRALYVFKRHEQIWFKEPAIYTFGKEALIRFSETLIVAVEPDGNSLMLFNLSDNQCDWSNQTFTLSRSITALALHNRLIVGYDDYQLWLFRHDIQAGWKQELLDSESNSISHFLELFDLETATRQQIVTTLNQKSLQILNNFILFNTLEENNSQLSSHTHLYMLDLQYKIAKKQSFKIERERINELTYKYENDESIYNIVYVKEEGRFKAHIKAISGKIIKDLINYYEVTNSSIIDDFWNGADPRVQVYIKHLNQQRKGSSEKYLFISSNLYTAQISQLGAYVGNDTLLRITGTGWEVKSLPTAQRIPLSKHFILESDNGGQFVLKLYKQSSSGNKQGQPIQELQLHAPDQIINGYPAYIAYHPNPNLIKVLTFKDEQTLGQVLTFANEQLLPGSDLQNLMTVANASSTTTVHAEPQECLVRPVSTFLPPKVKSLVNQMTLVARGIQRITAYEHSFNADQRALTYNAVTYNETVTIIPGNNKSAYGWHEATRSYYRGDVTKTERWFNADGSQVLGSPEEKSAEQTANATSTASNPMLLLDRSGKWLISDFSPYSLFDEVVAYYGFEPYENNQIGTSVANTRAKTWRTNQAQIIKGNFAFTGEHYLQLKSTATGQASFVEGLLQPRDQETTYLAACWIRCSTALTLDSTASYLKAIIYTSDGQKIIGLEAQTKRQLGEWSYLELPLNFQVLRQIYQAYVSKHSITSNNSMLPLAEDVSFHIILRVEAPANQIVDLDHIRFTPINQNFQAAIYHPIIGKPIAIVQGNGLVTRTIYNRLQQEIASTDEKDQLQEFSSSSRTGKLIPAPQGSMIDAKPNVITFEPEYGSYENFDTNAWRNRWKLDNPAAWKVAPGQLWHKQPGKHRVEARTHLFDGKSAAIRFYFALQESQSALSLNWQDIGNLKFTRQSDHLTNVVLPNGQSITKLPSVGELIVLLETNYLWVWLDGVLLVDQALLISRTLTDGSLAPWVSFNLEVEGKVLVEDCLIMNRPQVTVKYYNAFGEKTQVIQLEDARTVQVNEILYDALGREAITTKKTRIKRSAGQSLLTYRQGFVSNINLAHPQSVWHTGILQGEVNRLNPADEGVAYTRTEYASNPLDQEKCLGLPGLDFSITGRYATKISQHFDQAFLDNLFPTDQGYRQKVEHTANGSLRISVFDQGNNQVAKYVRVRSFNHLLSTYEYDIKNRLIKILPPLYHEKVDTASTLTAWQFGEDHLSSREQKWQEALATRFVYDMYGHLIRKITPDSGTTEYLYNAAGQKRFMVSLNATNQSQNIVYFDYDVNNQLISTGHINGPLSLTVLSEHLENKYLPHAEKYQEFDYADGHYDPLLRGRLQQYITDNDGQVIIEQLRFDAEQQVISKKYILAQAESDQLDELEKQYLNGKLQKLIYPIAVDNQPFHLLHSYNRLGELVGLGTSNNPTHYASFTYSATGQLASEQYQPNTQHSFTRSYNHNSPGFLEQISDPFLTEEIAYTEKGYGQAGYGDGMIMQTTINASWPVNADGRWFQVQENDLEGNYSAVCFKALKRTGYLTDSGKPIKLYIRDAVTALPLVCGGETGRHVAKLIAEKKRPTYYGHRYAYGNHQELVKAKYFIDDTDNLSNPLQPDSFSKEIDGLTIEQSRHIWQLLTAAGYIITDQQGYDTTTAFGKRGKSIFRNTDLHRDLALFNDKYTLYVEPIEQLIISAISLGRTLSLAEFEAAFLHWQNLDLTSPRLIYNWQKGIASDIGKMLLDKGYLPAQPLSLTHPLNSNFTTTLHQYASFIPKIVQTLSQYFAYGLGKTPFDIESYKIDANGNHQLFYTGFNRYELTYRTDTNQIKSVKLSWPVESRVKQVLALKHDGQGNVDWITALNSEPSFDMKHDGQGNVVQALHKNIKHIEYHPVSQRVTCIQLTDDRTLRFYYDAQGERVLKRVFDAEGKLSHETHYLRDEKGRVLIDRQTKYSNGSKQNIITAYLYGPRGLLGFIRNNSFYSVTTDHAGSVRLVIKDGSVVAAYDYLPYGELMRSYGNDPKVHVMYRYTGQEWDEETGLYNYHARLYDPSIGRFYQIDPKAQYASPYTYAGNSPIAVIDPDGEEAILLTCMVLGVIGAYLGGSAANNRWNPVDWDFKDFGTYFGIAGGGLAGGLLPLGFVASVGAIGTIGTVGLGVGGAYLTTAAGRGWDPSQWKWNRPDTWNSLFQGFSGGSGIAGGIGMVHNFANTGKAIKSLSNLNALKALGIGHRAVKGTFLTISYMGGGGMAYLNAKAANKGNVAFWEWDWTNPATWSGLVDGFDTGMGWPQNILEMGRGAGRLIKNPKKYLFSGQKNLRLKSILKDSKHPLYKTTTSIVMAYYMGSAANGNFDITKWNLAVFSTYEGVLNGVFFGKDVTQTLKYIRGSKETQPSNELVPVPKNKENHWSRNFGRMLDLVQESRVTEKYQHLVEEAFTASTPWSSKLSDQSPSIRSKVDNFFKKGLRKWKSGENHLPEELHRLIQTEASLKVHKDSELVRWKAESKETLRREQVVFPDEENVPFLNCRRAARRRKRSPGNQGCKIQGEPVVHTKQAGQHTKPELVKQLFDSKVRKLPDKGVFFESDSPVDFIRKYPISVRSVFDQIIGRKEVKNGEIYTFTLNKIKGEGEKYNLVLIENDNVPHVKGYWLTTSIGGDTSGPILRVSASSPEATLIFTGEMQGCSIYSRYNKETNEMEFFHYYREGVKGIFVNAEFGNNPFTPGRFGYLELNNAYSGDSILEGKNKFVLLRGLEDIPELSDAISLIDDYGKVIEIKDNFFIIDRPVYKSRRNGEDGQLIVERIETINGTPIQEIIQYNKGNIEKEKELAKKFDTVIRWEDYAYFGLPKTSEALDTHRIDKQNDGQKDKQADFVTLFLYFDRSDSSDPKWNVVSRQITYTAVNRAQDEFKLKAKEEEPYIVAIQEDSIRAANQRKAILENTDKESILSKNKGENIKSILAKVKTESIRAEIRIESILKKLQVSIQKKKNGESVKAEAHIKYILDKIHKDSIRADKDVNTIFDKIIIESIQAGNQRKTILERTQEVSILEENYRKNLLLQIRSESFRAQFSRESILEDIKKLYKLDQNNRNSILKEMKQEPYLAQVEDIKKEIAREEDYGTSILEEIKQAYTLKPNNKEDMRIADTSNPYPLTRNRRSINDTQDCITNSNLVENTLSNIRQSGIIQSKIVHKKGSENLSAEDTKNVDFDTASSGSSNLKFWPASLIKKAGRTIASIIPSNWLFSPEENKDLDVKNVLSSEPLVEPRPLVKAIEVNNAFLEAHSDPSAHQQPPCNPLLMGPTVPEVDEQWFKKTNMNGLLIWGTLLARKWTGYRPKAFKDVSYHPETDLELGMRSCEWVDAFMDRVQTYAQACGIEDAVSDAVENLTLYTQATETVRKKLAAEGPRTIVASLFDQIVKQNISKIASKSTPNQVNTFLDKVRENLPNMQQQFLKQTDSSQATSEEDTMVNATRKANSSLLKQEMSTMQSTNQPVDNTALLYNTYNTHYDIITPNNIDHGDRYRKCGSLQ